MQTETASRIAEFTDAALEQLRANLAAGRSDTLKAYLATMARFHRYSFGNQMLIAFQRPDATHVAGFNAWRKFNRFVRKGEKGILIIAPCARRANEVSTEQDEQSSENRRDTRGGIRFRGAYVFDVSSTDGDPLPEFAKVNGDPAIYMTVLHDAIRESGIAFSKSVDLGGAEGVSTGGAIVVREGLEPAAEFSVTVHEYAHELMHKAERRRQTSRKVKETEAEAVAFVVCHAIGLETGTAASDYLALYDGDIETLTESLEVIRRTANEILCKLGVAQ